MSGGHYDYLYQRCQTLADYIERDLEVYSEERHEWGEVYPPYPAHVLAAMETIRRHVETSAKLAKELEWFMSGDIGEEELLKAMKEILGSEVAEKEVGVEHNS